MKPILTLFLIAFQFQLIPIFSVSNFQCPMPILDSSGYLLIMTNQFSYYSVDNEGEMKSNQSIGTSLPCGKIIANNNDYIIIGVYPGATNSIAYVSMSDSRVYQSSFNFLSALPISIGDNTFVIGVLSNSNKITVLKLNGFQFGILTEIVYSETELITDITCTFENIVAFCSLFSNANEAKYVFIKYENNTFTKASNFILISDMSEYQYGCLYEYFNNSLLLFYFNSSLKMKLRMVSVHNSYYTFTNSPILVSSLNKPTHKLYFDTISYEDQFIACSPTIDNISCAIIVYDSAMNSLQEKKVIYLENISNSNYSLGRFTQLSSSITIAYSFEIISGLDYEISVLMFNEAKCANSPLLMGFNVVLILPLTYPRRNNDFIIFRNMPADTPEGSIYVDSQMAFIGLKYSMTKTFTFESDSSEVNTTISYEINNNYALFSFSSIRCDLVVSILPCYPSCQTCSIFGNLTDHKCTICKLTYYPHVDHLTNCYDESTKDINWILQGTEYKTCSSACQGCTHTQEFNEGKYNTHCIACADDYYPYISLPECRNEALKENNILFDKNNNKYVQCYLKCKTCSSIGNSISHNCIACLSPTDYFQYDTRNCIDELKVPTIGYYTDDINKTIYPCLTLCNTCTDNLSCLACKSSAYLYDDLCYTECPISTYILNRICVETCPDGTVLLKMKECVNIFEAINASDDPEVKVTRLAKDDFINAIIVDLLDYTKEKLITKGDGYVVQLVNKEHQEDNYQSAIELELTRIYGESCIRKLALNYSTTEKEIIIVKVDINQTNLRFPTNKVEYSFYNSEGRKLDSNLCRNENIQILFPLINTDEFNKTRAQQVIDQGYNPFDPTDAFFNNICTRFTTENKTDVTIEKRREDFYQNVTLCQNGCSNELVNITNLTVICHCKTILDISAKEVRKVFVDSISANFYVVKCYHLVFDYTYLKQSIGFWIIFGFNIINIILFGYLMSSGMKHLRLILLLPKYSSPSKKTLKTTQRQNSKSQSGEVMTIKTLNVNKNTNANQSSNYAQKYSCFNANYLNDRKLSLRYNYNIQNKDNDHIQIHNSREQSTNKSSFIQLKHNSIKLNKMIIPSIITHSNSDDNGNNIQTAPNKSETHSNDEVVKSKTFCKVIRKNYKEEQKNRTNLIKMIYFYIKTKHSVWITFVMIYLLELRVLKVIIFFNTIAIGFALNALFFTNNYFDMRYEDYIGFELISSIPKSLLSFILAGILGYIFNKITSSKQTIKLYLDQENQKKQFYNYHVDNHKRASTSTMALNNTKVKETISSSALNTKNFSTQSESQLNTNIKVHTSTDNLQTNSNETESSQSLGDKSEERRVMILRVIKLKYLLFFILNMILMLLFWYYVSAFCIVMNNSQLSWIYGCLKSLGFSLLIPLGLAIVLGIIKWISIRCQIECLYYIVAFVSYCLDIC